jgi:hypothetical protein
MKTFFFFTLLSILLFSCNSNGNNKTTSSNAIAEKRASENNSSTEKEIVRLSGLKVKKERFKAEKCLDVPREEWMEEDPEPFCASIVVELMKITLNDEEVAEKINAQIASTITGKRNDINIKSFVNKVKSIKEVEEASQEDYSCTLFDSTNRMLSIGVGSSYMAYMAAHPGGNLTILNFDLETGSTIGLQNVLIEDYLKPLKGIVYNKFIKKNGKQGWDFTNVNNFKLAKNVAIKRKGLLFSYNSYEIGSYASGAPEILVSWEELKELRKENPYISFN